MTVKITNLKIQNFKTFDYIDLNLKNLNLLIGINASGKSNLISVFRFLRDIVNEGIENAISIQGGMKYLLNSKNGINKTLILEFEILLDEEYIEVPIQNNKETKARLKQFGVKITNFNKSPKSLFIDLRKTHYYFELEFFDSQDFIIKDDYLVTSGIIFTADSESLQSTDNEKSDIKNKNIIGEASFKTTYNDGLLNFEIKGTVGEPYEKLLKDIFYPRRPIKIPKKCLVLQDPFFIESSIAENLLKKLVVYDIDPKLSKKSAFISGKKDLEEDGSNLALIIKNILNNKEKSDEFYTMVSDLLPFVAKFDVDTFGGKNLLFKMKEIYDDDYWPATFLSDGTVNVISLVIATYFGEKNLMIFEEPEKNIHPALISKILNLFKEASEESQIIITSHNPEFVKYADVDDILFIRRNINGFSEIIKPLELEKVKEFLDTDLGLDALFIRNLIGE